MPSAKVSTATVAKPGLLPRPRSAYRTSRQYRSSSASPLVLEVYRDGINLRAAHIGVLCGRWLARPAPFLGIEVPTGGQLRTSQPLHFLLTVPGVALWFPPRITRLQIIDEHVLTSGIIAHVSTCIHD